VLFCSFFFITYAFDRVNRRLKQVIAEETAKQKAAMDKLREYDKLQFMDKIISSIAHEIRNPLAAIRFYAEQIPYKMDNPRFMAAMAEDIPPEIERIDALIKEFIEYTAPRRPNRESVPCWKPWKMYSLSPRPDAGHPGVSQC
jgi:signal transduction histidine kinase